MRSLLILTAILLTACATNTPVATDTFCLAYQPVYTTRVYRPQNGDVEDVKNRFDTKATIDGVTLNNVVYDRLCKEPRDAE